MSAASLALGTAQLGMPYGVAGRPEGVSPAVAHDILRTAVDLGIDYLDTAPSYGRAESVVGEFFANAGQRFAVGTKTPVAAVSRSDLAAAYRTSLLRSCEHLRVESVDDLSIHALADLREHGASVIEVLEQLRDEGRVRRLGASIYEPQDVDLVLQYASLRVIQLPFSVFNRALVDSGSVARLRAAGHAIVARSVVHQGLLMLSPEAAEGAVSGAGVWVQRFQAICERHRLSPLAAAVGYARVRSGADRVLVGVDNPEQLRAIAAAIDEQLSSDALADFDEELRAVPATVADPRRWPVRPTRAPVESA